VNDAIFELLLSAPEVLVMDLRLMATVLQSTIAGVKRQLLESNTPETELFVLQRELVLWCEVMSGPVWPVRVLIAGSLDPS
jgi:hypothetical protein